jgi:hypothetical protein
MKTPTLALPRPADSSGQGRELGPLLPLFGCFSERGEVGRGAYFQISCHCEERSNLLPIGPEIASQKTLAMT